MSGLKSTYKPSPGVLQPLPPGWTEHKAPTGHTYYYHAATNTSTYQRPGAPTTPSQSYMQHQSVPAVNLSDPNVANAFMAQYSTQPAAPRGGFGHGGGRGGDHHNNSRPRPQPHDRPKAKVAIPGCDPWILVYTKYGRRFAYNPAKNASYWRIPDKLKAGILALDQARIREKAGLEAGDAAENKAEPTAKDDEKKAPVEQEKEQAGEKEDEPAAQHDYDSSEYEEVEVTDDEEGEPYQDGSAPKRQRTEEPPAPDGPVEFTEADIVAQLAAMGADYGGDDAYGEAEYDGEGADFEVGDTSAPPLSDEDARLLFTDLLNDLHISPYTPWDILLEQGKIVADPRYTALPTTKARKAVWEEWSRAAIAAHKERRAREAQRDPRIPFLALLSEKATPKLFWPEFKRKYRAEPAMRDRALADRDRERLYREHVKRLALPRETARADLRALLSGLPLRVLNSRTDVHALPSEVLGDLRYVTLDAKSRDEFVAAYVQDLGAPPEDGEEDGAEEGEARRKEREDRRRREKALQERERAVMEEKRRVERRTAAGKARLREEEREIERAMQVGKKGLMSQLGIGEGQGGSGGAEEEREMDTAGD